MVRTVCCRHGDCTIVVGILEFKLTDLSLTPVINMTLATLLDHFELKFFPINKDK